MAQTTLGAFSSTLTRVLGMSLKALLIESLVRIGLLCYVVLRKFEVTRIAIIPSEIAYQYNYPLAAKETVPMTALEPIVALVALAVFILARVVAAVCQTKVQLRRQPVALGPLDTAEEMPFQLEQGGGKRGKLKVGCLTDFVHFVLALSLMGLASYCAVKHLKVWVARPRPDFFARCYRSPLRQLGSILPARGGSNEASAGQMQDTHVLAAAEILTPQYGTPGEDPQTVQAFHCPLPLTDPVINDGLQSFPSGHSACAWSVAMFCFLYLRNRWRVQQRIVYSARAEQPLLCGAAAFHSEAKIVPPVMLFTAGTVLFLGATFVSCSRITDYKHHPLDVIAGGVIGVSVAALSFWLYYPVEDTIVQAGERLVARNEKYSYGEASSLVESALLKRNRSWVADDSEGIKGNGGFVLRTDGLGTRELGAQADRLLGTADTP